MNLINIIYQTNGDFLGVILFILLLVYFYYLEQQTIVTQLLAVGCICALIVDLFSVYRIIKK
jgi:hypothetical protein